MMYSVLGLEVSPKDIGNEFFFQCVDSFSSKAHEWDVCWLEEVAVDVHAVKGAGEKDVSRTASVDQDFLDDPSLDVSFNYQSISV